MVSPKKLIEIARRWQRPSASSKRLSSAENINDSNICSTSVSEKGHFVVYSLDGRRFVVPLRYIESSIFVELFKMSEDEFGLPSNGPITLPCDAMFMEFILSLLRRRGCKAMDRVMLDSVFKHHHYPYSSYLVGSSQQVVCSF